MISKLLMLRRVGLFKDGLESPIEFRKFNVVYADNGRGKSTLSDVFRSLSNGDGSIITDRHTFNETCAAEIKVLYDGNQCYFHDGRWSKIVPEIIVFDSIFVNSNVYSGTQVDAEHRKNLHRFALGEQGVKLAERVEGLNQEIRDLTEQMSAKEAQIQPYTVGGVTVDAFARLPKTDDVDEVIAGRQRDVEAIMQQAAIAGRPLLECASWPELRIEEYGELLQATVDSIARDAETRIKDHIRQHLDATGEKWLEKGLTYITDATCPFCGQPLGNASLLESYRGYFSAAYAELKDRIQVTIQSLQSLFSEDELLAVQRSILGNRTEQEFWSKFVDVSCPEIDWESLRSIWTSLREQLLKTLRTKATNPLEEIEFAAELEETWRQFTQASSTLLGYNTAVESRNAAINSFKQSTATGNLTDATAKLNVARNEKNRWMPEVAVLCEDRLKLQTRKAELEKQKKAAREELDKYTEAVLSEYEESINDFLSKCGAAFKIVNVKTAYTGGEPRSDYQIEILNCKMDVSGKKSASCSTFKSVLSDGDKRTLAFAFFLARLERDPELANRIIVCDDPVSSLDIHRQAFTHQRLVRVGEQCKQMIVLTHDAHFAKRHWEDIRKTGTLLQISRVGDYSKLLGKCDIDKICQMPYARNTDILCEYISDGWKGDLIEVARCIRPVMEGHLRIHFPKELRSAKMLGEIIKTIREADTSSPLAKIKPHLKEMEDINAYAVQFHHDENPTSYTVPISDSELRGYVQRSLHLMSSI